MDDAPSPLAPGVVIAETYEIERQLGQGGMGEVWLARHLRLAGKQVAIKVLHVDRQLPSEALSRFKREAEIAARLEHPNIVQVLDFSALPTGQPFLVMEFLKGQTLAQRARGKTFSVEQVSSIMRQVAAALQMAHRAGVVHRDLKPENIFLVPTALGDQVKVVDFGISKLSDSNTVQTTDSSLLGTPLYMSPEQALGNNRDVAPQSDLFSLGSICYELFTGKAPFAAENIARVVFRIAYETYTPLSALRPDLPAPVVTAIEHALEKERHRRTPNIETFVFELTGQPLASIAEAHTSGVYTPGMEVTPSMSSGQTRSPSSQAPLATPAPSPILLKATVPQPVETPAPPAKNVSGRVVIISIVVSVLVIAGVVTKVRMDNWAERAGYRAEMIDAGYVLLDDGTLVKDAGLAESPRAEVIPDAGENGPVEPVSPNNAALAAVKPKMTEAPPSKSEETLLATLTSLEREERWEDIWEMRGKIRNQLKTSSARVRGLGLVVNAACARSDNAQLGPMVAEFKAVASRAQVRAARQSCTKRYPSAEFLDW